MWDLWTDKGQVRGGGCRIIRQDGYGIFRQTVVETPRVRGERYVIIRQTVYVVEGERCMEVWDLWTDHSGG